VVARDALQHLRNLRTVKPLNGELAPDRPRTIPNEFARRLESMLIQESVKEIIKGFLRGHVSDVASGVFETACAPGGRAMGASPKGWVPCLESHAGRPSLRERDRYDEALQLGRPESEMRLRIDLRRDTHSFPAVNVILVFSLVALVLGAHVCASADHGDRILETNGLVGVVHKTSCNEPFLFGVAVALHLGGRLHTRTAASVSRNHAPPNTGFQRARVVQHR